ncbi:PREDICTED: uncharacterized protein LOC108771785 [Cyphomyrmex costatus]|uniref:uncharacterized protein LOC108771785 n=1 Tax=Cyphomyrmex costatus TaxID=456900 RepID=UPI00085222C5|nr:PREDICTED: uncharacterized protein LOC108771785 [Cyphomyrmex costatus]
MLETSSKAKNVNPRSQSQANTKHQSCVASIKAKCVFCKSEHLVYHCEGFLALPVPQRISEIKKRKIFVNCLRATDHVANKCPSGSCKVCKGKHNTLLHIPAAASAQSNPPVEQSRVVDETASAGGSTAIVMSNSIASDHSDVMLSTAIAFAYDSEGRRKSCRILLDSGSQANFVSRRFMESFNIKARSSDVSISGINNTTTRSFQAANIRLHSRTNAFSFALDWIVTERITGRLPAVSFKRNAFEIPHNFELADPQFHVASEIDVLIGAEHFWNLICVGQIRASSACPTLQKTRFGWSLAGRSHNPSGSSSNIHSFHASISNVQLHDQLSRFWEIEDIATTSSVHTADEAFCEQHFVQNVSRAEQGRFVVKLSFKGPMPPKFVGDRDIALKQLRGIEKRFNRDPQLKERYSQFIDEYSALGHMKKINEGGGEVSESFHLPHHCITKAPASGKFRVVFDASAKDATGVSLNDVLMVGPTVQQDLFTILVRFRTFRFALSADIVKMYRQVLVHPSQTNYQRILWRNQSTSDIIVYELLTLTYGTSPASFLATRCLKWLSEHCAVNWPRGATCVGRDFYVDDMLTGADTIDEALAIRDETIEVLRSAAFELGKWASSCPELLAGVKNQNNDPVIIHNGPESSVLGIHWIHSQDTFRFYYEPDDNSMIPSKRIILSENSRIFDPLGLLGPVTVRAKLILQELWQLGIH